MPRVLVLGAGFGGIATAVALLRAGFDDLLVVEAADGIGGVWRDNTYPGCTCDVAAALYSFSFAPNPDWSRRFPPRAEILAYLEDCATRFGVRPHLRLGTRVTAARWDEAALRWHVETADGEVLVADVLVSAVGQLSRPHVPHLPGAEKFTGRTFHSARWPEDLDVRGQRVAVVGTGASAVQFVPHLAREAASVTVFQRSAPWTLPKPDRAYGPLARGLARVPGVLRARRGLTRAVSGFAGLAVHGGPVRGAVPRAAFVAASAVQRFVQVRDPELRRRLTPDHPLGCKRVLLTSDWLPTLARPDVELVTAAITDVTAGGIRTADGREHPCDVLVHGTGFAAAEFLVPLRVTGRDGADLQDVWRDGAFAHLGLTVPGFPNLLLLYGPNTNTGNTSVLLFEEAQARYVVQAVARLAAAGGRAALEVRPEVAAAFDTEMRGRLAGSVWTACSNWYRAAGGRVVTNWPGSTREYLRRTARLRGRDHVLRTRADVRARDELALPEDGPAPRAPRVVSVRSADAPTAAGRPPSRPPSGGPGS